MFRWRLVIFLLAFVLPLQFSWSAVSGYCQHESGTRAKHFGHHEHVHKADTHKSADAKTSSDADCGTCNGLGTSFVIGSQAALPSLDSSAAPVAAPPRDPPSLPPDSPYRPQWPRLA